MEETLKLILEGIGQLNEKVSNMESDIKDLKQGQQEINSEQQKMKETLNSIHEQTADLLEFKTTVIDTLETIESKVDRTDRDVINIKSKLRVIK